MGDATAEKSPDQARAQLNEEPQNASPDDSIERPDKITSWLHDVPTETTQLVPYTTRVGHLASINSLTPEDTSAMTTRGISPVMRPKILVRPSTRLDSASDNHSSAHNDHEEANKTDLSEFCTAKSAAKTVRLCTQIRPLARSDMAMTIPQAKELRKAGRIADVPFCQYEQLLGVCEHREKRCVWLHVEEWEECLLFDNLAEESYFGRVAEEGPDGDEGEEPQAMIG